MCGPIFPGHYRYTTNYFMCYDKLQLLLGLCPAFLFEARILEWPHSCLVNCERSGNPCTSVNEWPSPWLQLSQQVNATLEAAQQLVSAQLIKKTTPTETEKSSWRVNKQPHWLHGVISCAKSLCKKQDFLGSYSGNSAGSKQCLRGTQWFN